MYGQIPFNGALNMATKASLLSKINFSSILTNTQKILNVINQAVPLYYQTKPLIKNIKTVGKIGKEFSKINTYSSSNNDQKNNVNNYVNQSKVYNYPEPTFFI